MTENARDNVIYLYNASATVNGGNFDGTRKILGSNPTFNWKGSSCLMLTSGGGKSSLATVNGGNFVANEADLFVHDANCAIYVYDGIFRTNNILGNSPLHIHSSASTCLIDVCGGTFAYDPSDCIVGDYQVVKGASSYVVVSKEALPTDTVYVQFKT